MNSLSAIIITYNEEINISSCLNSLNRIADEIIVVDSYSTDRTRELCKAAGAKVFTHAFEGYGQQKSYAANLATHDMILSLDADESLDEEAIAEIQNLKRNGFDELYLIKRKTFYCGHWVKYCGWYPDKKLRLWNRIHANWSMDKLHETVLPNNPHAPTQLLKGNILHYSYKTTQDHLNQLDRFSTIAAKKYFDQGKKSFLFQAQWSYVIKFLEIFIYKLGILDGKTGFTIALLSAYGQFLKYHKLHLLNRS